MLLIFLDGAHLKNRVLLPPN